MSQWTLFDPVTSETWIMPINPDGMSSPLPSKKSLKHASGSGTGSSRVRSFMAPPAPVEWQWEGVIRTELHFNTLLAWAEKPNAIHVTDHLGRTWNVVVRKFAPTERKPNPLTPWRLRYQMSVLCLGGVA